MIIFRVIIYIYYFLLLILIMINISSIVNFLLTLYILFVKWIDNIRKIYMALIINQLKLMIREIGTLFSKNMNSIVIYLNANKQV